MVAVVSATEPFTVVSRSVVLPRGFSLGSTHADYDVAKDGTILAFQSPNESTEPVVVRNLGSEIRARVRGSPR